MKALSVRKDLLLAWCLGLYCTWNLVTSLYIAWGFTTDDAYISWFYARQLVQGKGLLWHVTSPPVEGYSNFLWVMIASLVIRCHLPLIITMKFISCFSLLAGLVFLYRLGRLFFSPLLSMLPIFLFSYYAGVVWWTVSGLESIFYCALALLLVLQCMQACGYQTIKHHCSDKVAVEPSTRAWVISNIALLLLCLTRFEGPVWLVPVVLFLWCHLKKTGFRVFFKDSGMIYLWGCITVFCFILPYTAWFIWRFSYFGHWIPNSYSCKSLVSGQFFVVDFDYLQVIIPLIVAALPYFLAHKKCRHLLLWLPSLLYAVLLWKADPVIAHFLRLFLAPFALFSLLPVLGVYQFLHYFKKLKLAPELITALVIISMTLLFIQGNETQFLKASVLHYQERTQNRLAISRMLNEQATRGSTVLLDDCGITPFYTRSDIRFIDAQCLNNSELTSSAWRNNLRGYADHLQKDLKPDWVITNFYPLVNHGDLLTELLEKKNFFKDYQLVAVFESGIGLEKKSGKVIDYVYKVYRRLQILV